ncbi:serine hydrolase domain-containing protein [Bogoriella caseilytica]|uniref:CubicO group peptidase (Beta-lactamase class C family) n=1 Tax=Bogoriella caseilytica TaxID=56055 RepID=A0A3N2BCV6_9MICO|nr:serine hydrolase domain-containing protein [Bogoriella caseilytica]ROR73080.1 CubicO group peptidase (beta-lactamase class C family) [Bogoriella caseilytica]
MNLQASLTALLHESTQPAAAGPAPAIAAGEEALPATPGAAAAIFHRGELVARAHAGYAVLFDADGALLPEADREAITADHRWDIASITKIAVAMTALVQADRGVIDLEAPVVEYLPEFRHARAGAEGERGVSPEVRAEVRLRHLLNHTAGFPAVSRLWQVEGGRQARAEHVLSTPLERASGSEHVYSCVGFMTLGLALERLTGVGLPQLMTESVLEPLGLSRTSYGPISGPVAATEYQPGPGRGLVHGEVHDEAAWALGGSGNAGLFSDALDIARLGEEVRTGAAALLREDTRALLYRGTLGTAETERVGYDQALGFRLGQQNFMDTTDRGVIGHTGFVGTSLVIDAARELTVALMTNRVHPDRSAFTVMPLRRAVARAAAEWAEIEH